MDAAGAGPWRPGAVGAGPAEQACTSRAEASAGRIAGPTSAASRLLMVLVLSRCGRGGWTRPGLTGVPYLAVPAADRPGRAQRLEPAAERAGRPRFDLSDFTWVPDRGHLEAGVAWLPVRELERPWLVVRAGCDHEPVSAVLPVEPQRFGAAQGGALYRGQGPGVGVEHGQFPAGQLHGQQPAVVAEGPVQRRGIAAGDRGCHVLSCGHVQDLHPAGLAARAPGDLLGAGGDGVVE